MPIKLLALLSFLAPVLLKLLRWLVRCRSTEVIQGADPPHKPVIFATNLRVIIGPTKKVTDGTCRFSPKKQPDHQWAAYGPGSGQRR